MTQTSCAWPTACIRPLHGHGLCKRHHQLASRRGILNEFKDETRLCAECGLPLPPECRTRRAYCSKRCYNVAYYRRRDPAERLDAHQAWRKASAPRRAAERLAARRVRGCEECGADLPIGANRRRRYCSRKCINAVSLREKREERYEASQRRRARLLGASVPGLQDRDWSRLVARLGGRCAYCRRPGPMTIDHVIPLSRGGRHAIGNVLPACRSCNSSKRDDLLVYWRAGVARARLKPVVAA